MKRIIRNLNIERIEKRAETVTLKMQIETNIKCTTDVPIIFSFTKENLIIEQIPNTINMPSVYPLKEWYKESATSIFINIEKHYSAQSIIVKNKDGKVAISIKFKDGRSMDFTETL